MIVMGGVPLAFLALGVGQITGLIRRREPLNMPPGQRERKTVLALLVVSPFWIFGSIWVYRAPHSQTFRLLWTLGMVYLIARLIIGVRKGWYN